MSGDADSSDAPGRAEPTLELEDARDLMLAAAAVFDRWQERLQAVADRMPEPRYQPRSDEPINLAAAIQGLLQGLLHDEVREFTEALRSTAQWIDDPDRRRPPS